MKTIKLLMLMSVLTTLTAMAQPKGTRTVITGYIPGYKDSTIKVNCSYPSDKGIKRLYDTISTNLKSGYFKLEIKTSSNRNITLQVGNKLPFYGNGERFKAGGGIGLNYIYVAPGDSLHFVFNGFGLDNVTGSGRGIAKFEYQRAYHQMLYADASALQQRVAKMASFKERYGAAYIDITLGKLMLKKYSDGIDEHSQKYILAQNYIRNFNHFPTSLLKGNPTDPDIIAAFNQFRNNEDFNLIFELSSDEIHQMYPRAYLAETAYLEYAIQSGKKYIPNESPSRNFEILQQTYRDLPYKDKLLADYMNSYASTKGIEKVQPALDNYLASIGKDHPHYRELSTFRDEVKSVQSTKPAYVFSLPDINGKLVSLSDFKGKVVVMDFWFTGCVGCIGVAKAMPQIEEEFKGQDVVFISISPDKNILSWKKGIGRFSSPGSIQLNTGKSGYNHPVITKNFVLSFPTLMVVGRDGNLISARAPRPEKFKIELVNIIKAALTDKPIGSVAIK